ncbi:MAG TPA: hypothetical protein VGC05_11365 [Mycobacterium sp.]
MHTIPKPQRLSRKATLLVALMLAALGLTVLSATANAAFTLNSGSLSLTDGNGTTDPPSGSWVTLPTDNPKAVPPYFENPTTSWKGTPKGKYTLIRNKDSVLGSTALTLGSTQAGGIFGDTTDKFAGVPFTAVDTSAPTLTFEGSASETGTRKLTSGDLSGLEINYGEGTYNVGTTTASGGMHIVPLHGTITGAVGGKKTVTITLDWTSDLTEPGFEPYEAHFHWVGDYTP